MALSACLSSSKMNTTVPRQKSIRFFMMMLPAFFARVKPVSTIAKPACMNQTRMAPIRYHTPAEPKIPSMIYILLFYENLK